MCFYRIILITALAFYTISGNSQSLQHEVKVNSVILKLHEKSGFYSNNAFFDENNHSYVRTTGHPKLGGFIEEYDLFTGQLKHLWHVGESPDLGAFVKLNDFQYWVFNQTNRQLLLIDSGKIVKKYQESDYQEKSIFITYFADCQFNNIILHENNIYVISNLLAAIRFTPPRHAGNVWVIYP